MKINSNDSYLSHYFFRKKYNFFGILKCDMLHFTLIMYHKVYIKRVKVQYNTYLFTLWRIRIVVSSTDLQSVERSSILLCAIIYRVVTDSSYKRGIITSVIGACGFKSHLPYIKVKIKEKEENMIKNID